MVIEQLYGEGVDKKSLCLFDLTDEDLITIFLLTHWRHRRPTSVRVEQLAEKVSALCCITMTRMVKSYPKTACNTSIDFRIGKDGM